MMVPSKSSVHRCAPCSHSFIKTVLAPLVLLIFASSVAATLTVATNANERAAARSKAGMTRELEQFRDDNLPHPSRGGSRGCPLWCRRHVLRMANRCGMDIIEDLDVSPSSVCRWIARVEPRRMTGGRDREALTGQDQILLSIGLFICPDSKADEPAAFVFHHGGELYSRQVISSRMNELDSTKKVCSTEAHQAFTEINMRKARWFWSKPPPLGVVGCQRRRLVDFDEMAVFLETCNPKHGHAHKTIRIRKPGFYAKSKKITVIMAIEAGDPSLPAGIDGSIQNPRRWFWIREESGANAVDFATFCDRACISVETHPAQGSDADLECIFMWDNLNSHHAPIVAQTVEGRPSPNVFKIVPRPPCQPKHGPIEYIFAEIGEELEKRVRPDWTLVELKAELQWTCGTVGRNGKFDNTFDHCGH